MTWNLFLALFTFAGIAAWTPGPNNTILLASGINYGFKRTVPMILGVALGFPFMIGVVGLGLGEVFKTYPLLYSALKYAGSAYMLWLAYKILVSKPGVDANAESKPLTFVQGALFQWINPKAWAIAITVVASYTIAASYNSSLALVVATFVFMGLTSASGWTMFGSSLRHFLTDPRYYRYVNAALSVTLIASLVMMLQH